MPHPLHSKRQNVKAFFVQHSEKVFCVATVAVVIFIVCVGSRSDPNVQTSPQQLSRAADRAAAVMAMPDSWQRIEPYRQANVDAALLAAKPVSLDIDRYSLGRLTGATVKLRPRRTDPRILSPEHLEIQYVRAAVALTQTQNDGSPKAKLDRLPKSDLTLSAEQRYERFEYRPKWAKGSIDELLVVDAVAGHALVPYAQQQSEYQQIFVGARNYDRSRDRPRYELVEVQRRSSDQQDWSPLTRQIYSATQRLAQPAVDPVDSQYRIRNLTLEIPALVGVDYKRLAMHSSIDMVQQITLQADASSTETSAKNSSPDSTASAPLRLIRFFDLEPKEPGESYQYRVRTWVVDPNHTDLTETSQLASVTGPTVSRGGMQADAPAPGGDDEGVEDGSAVPDLSATPLAWTDLAAEVRSRQATPRQDIPELPPSLQDLQNMLENCLPSPWSEPSDWVNIDPEPYRIVAGRVEPSATVPAGDEQSYEADEPVAMIAVSHFDDKLGARVHGALQTRRGGVINFRSTGLLLHPADWTIRTIDEGTDKRGETVGKHFETNAILLDVMGGHRQPFATRSDQLNAPSEMIVVDGEGNFHVLNELHDQTQYRHSRFVSEKEQTKKSQMAETDNRDR